MSGGVTAAALGVGGAALTAGLSAGGIASLTLGSAALGGALGLAGYAAEDIIGGAKAPASSGAPAATLTQQSAASQDQQTAELATAGGAAGSQLQPDQVKQRDTLFGN